MSAPHPGSTPPPGHGWATGGVPPGAAPSGRRGPRRWLVLVVAAVVLAALVVLAFVTPGFVRIPGVPTAQTTSGPSSTANGTTTPSPTRPVARGPVRGLPETVRLVGSALEDKDKAALKKLRCAKTTKRVDQALRLVDEMRRVLASDTSSGLSAQWRFIPLYATPHGEPDVDLYAVVRQVDRAWCIYDVTGGYTVAARDYGFPNLPRGFPYELRPVVEDFLAKVNAGDDAGAAGWSCTEPEELRSDIGELLAGGNVRIDPSRKISEDGSVPIVGTRDGKSVEAFIHTMKRTELAGLTCILSAYAP